MSALLEKKRFFYSSMKHFIAQKGYFVGKKFVLQCTH